MGRLNGKIAIITGAASGIGQATARRIAAEGARAVVADVDAAGAKEVAAAITAAGGEAIAVAADLADIDAVRGMVEAAVTAYGGLDILHNNAAATRLAATEDLLSARRTRPSGTRPCGSTCAVPWSPSRPRRRT